MEQEKKKAATAVKETSGIHELAALSKRLDFTKKKGVNWSKQMPQEAKQGETWVYGYCMGCMQADCSTKNYIKDGVLVNIEGNPESPTNQGKVCPRAIAAIMGLYNPYRVKVPLKRTNTEKGPDIDPGWVEITWEEAINTTVEKFKKIRQEDPRKLAVWEGWGAPETFLITCKEIDKSVGYKMGYLIWPKAFGTPNELFGRNLCAIHYATNLTHGHMPEYISDLEFCKYLIAPGRSSGPNVAATHTSKHFLDAIDRGMKVVTLDPRLSPEGTKGYRWLPVRPGTELAFALAMIHTILYELKKFDEWFVKNRTNGPYLIGPDGFYFRNKSTKKPLVWDAAENKAKTFDDTSVKEYVLWGEYTIDGVKVHPALQLVKDRMKEYTADWAAGITSVPAETIREVTKEFVEHAQIGATMEIDGFKFPYRPVQFAGSGRGAVSQRAGTLFDLAGKIINELVGAMEVPGGATGNRCPGPGAATLQPNEDGVVTPIMESIGGPFKFPPDHVAMNEFYAHSHATPQVMARVLIDPDKYHLPYKLEAMLNCGANSMRSQMDRGIMIDGFKKVPFLVTFAINYDETTMMSDIVFPEHQFLERKYARFYLVTHQNLDDSVRGLTMVLGRNPVKPLFNTRLMDDVLLEIADKCGFMTGTGGINDTVNLAFQLKGKYALDINKKYTMDEMIDRRVKQVFGEEYSFDYLLKHGVLYRFDTPGKLGYNYYYWPDNKTRHPIYFDRLKQSGQKMRKNLKDANVKIPNWDNQEDYFKFYEPIPYWIAGPEVEGPPPEYDMWISNWKTPFMPHGTADTQQNAWLAEMREVDEYEMFIWINSETAKKKDFKDDDLVWIESRWGKTLGKLKVTELIHPEVLGVPACYGASTPMMSPDARKGTYYNILLTGKEDVGMCPISGSVTVSPKVKVYKAK